MLSTKTKRNVPAILLVFMIAVFVFAVARPDAVLAQWVVSAPVVEAQQAKESIWDKIQKKIDKWWKRTGSRAFQQSVRSVSYKLAQDTALFIANGGKGQKPLIFQDFGKYMESLPDVVAGKFLSNVTAGWPINICSPSSIQSRLAITIGLGKSLDELMFPTRAISQDTGLQGCKITEIVNNFEKAVQAKNFLVNVSTTFEPGKNELSATNVLYDFLTKKKEQTVMEQVVERLKNGDLSVQQSAAIFKTAYPKITQEQLVELQREAQRQAFAPPPRTEDIFVDTLAVFANTLSRAYLQKLQSGFYPFRSSGGSGSPDSEISGDAGSAKALLASFDVFSPQRAAEIKTSGEIDLFDEMTNCPPAQYRTPYNCLLNDGLRQAVQQELTVKQALDRSLLNPNLSFPEPDNSSSSQPPLSIANLRKLRLLRVVSVGWELAGELIAKSPAHTLLLKDAVNCFNIAPTAITSASSPCNINKVAPNAGNPTDPNKNPLYHLIDPQWALVLPPQYCRAQGYGSMPESEQSSSRKELCVDLQSCIKVDASGKCVDNNYGYCTRERGVWRLEGQSCAPQYATCQALKRPDGSSISILGSDVKKQGCTQANAGCTWYSVSKSGVTWNSGAGERIYLTSLAPSCRPEDAGSCEIIPLEPGVNLARNDNASQEIEIKPYTYYTLSFTAPAGAALTARVAGPNITNVSFRASDPSSAEITVPNSGSATRYAATFYSGSTRNVTLTFTGGSASKVQLEEISLADGQRALETVAANAGAGVEVLNVSPEGSRNSASPATPYKDYKDNRKLVFANARLCGEPKIFPAGDPAEASARKYMSLSSGETKVARLTDQNLCVKECSGLESFLKMPTQLELMVNSQAPAERASFIPEQTQICSAADAGCEEFTNLSLSGSEKREYYRQIRECVSDSNPNAATFYTWEGTDTAGFQLKAWQLLAGNDGGPCTNFPPGSVLDSKDASCKGGSDECALDVNSPNCRVFLNENGKEFKRDVTKTVTATTECRAFRRSNDNKTWYFSAKESQSCSAAAVGCHEYKGGQANLVRDILVSDFEHGDKGGWDHVTNDKVVAESYIAGGSSIEITAGAGKDINRLLSGNFVGKSYILSFDAKGANNNAKLDFIRLEVGGHDYEFVGSSPTASPVLNIYNDWQHYTVGPVFYDSLGEAFDKLPPSLMLRARDGNVYVDNIRLSEIENRVFALEKTTLPKASGGSQPDACYVNPETSSLPRYDSCQAWRDDSNNTFYVSRFDKLFGPESLYCRAVIDTQGSDSFDGQVFNKDAPSDNEFDNYTVKPDLFEYRVIRPENLRTQEAAGCTEVGVPNDVYAATPASWKVDYKKIDPDAFDRGAMCRVEALGCQSFKSKSDATFVFKDPGKKLCAWSARFDGFVRIDPATGEETDVDCYGDNAGWIGQCPAEQSGCTTYLPSDPALSEGGASALFMLADTVEPGNCKAGDSIESGCAPFTENATSTSPLIKENLLVNFQARTLAVKASRECAEWLAPTTSSEVTDPKTRTKRTVVYDLGSCQKLGSDGRCTQWATNQHAKLDVNIYQNRVVTGKNIYSGAWDYSSYSIPGQFPAELLTEADMAPLSCRSYPEEDSPFSSAGLDYDSKTGNFIYNDGTRALEKLNKCEFGDVCECSYKKITSTDQGVKYYSLKTEKVFPETTESITNLNGWQGYCVEKDSGTKDPNGNPVCLAWWPVDVPAAGTNIFDNHPEAGFNLGGPLYYCAQAKGNKLENTDYGITSISQANNNYLIKVRRDIKASGVVGWSTYAPEKNNNFGLIQTRLYRGGRKVIINPLSFYPSASSGDKSYYWDIDCVWNNEGGCLSSKDIDKYQVKSTDAPGYTTISIVYDNNGWSTASHIISWPVDANSPLSDLHEYDIEKIILKPRKTVQGTGLYEDWPTATEQLILQRDGWANNGETTNDRWTALWCGGDKCDFGKDGYSWERFEPIIDDVSSDAMKADGSSATNLACSGLMAGSKTNLLGIRAVFADAQGKIPGQENYLKPTGFLRRIMLAKADNNQNFASWNSFLGKVKPYQFLGLEGGLCDGSDSEGWVDFDIGIQLREWCSVVAKVDESGGNKAWTGRLNQKSVTSYPKDQSIYNATISEYGKGALINLYKKNDGTTDYNAYYSQDSAPFGSIVPPASTIYHPNLWDARKDEEEQDPLSPQAEPKLLEPGNQPLYVETVRKQVRAGTPYSCEDDACVLPPTEKGIKVKPQPSFNDDNRLDNAKTYLLQLFSKIQSLWRWTPGTDGNADSYKEETAAGWDLGNIGECPIIMNLDQGGNSAQPGNCDPGGMYSINNKAAKNGNQPIEVNLGEPIKLQFYAYNQNGEQLPLKKIEIDWNGIAGDSDITVIKGDFKNHKPTSCNNSSQNYGDTDKACVKDYFEFQHVYKKEDSFRPKVTITDNWGSYTVAEYTTDVITVNKAAPRAAGVARSSTSATLCTEDTWIYSDYGACSAEGKQARTATIDFNCPTVTTPPILSKNCTNGGWSGWGDCNKICGSGTQARACNSPAPAGDGLFCLKSDGSRGSDESRACNTQACPKIDGGWSGWGVCNKTCGGGEQARTCNSPTPANGGLECLKENGTRGFYESKGCNTQVCGCPAGLTPQTRYGKADICPAANKDKAAADAWCRRTFHPNAQAGNLGQGSYCNGEPYNEIECGWCG